MSLTDCQQPPILGVLGGNPVSQKRLVAGIFGKAEPVFRLVFRRLLNASGEAGVERVAAPDVVGAIAVRVRQIGDSIAERHVVLNLIAGVASLNPDAGVAIGIKGVAADDIAVGVEEVKAFPGRLEAVAAQIISGEPVVVAAVHRNAVPEIAGDKVVTELVVSGSSGRNAGRSRRVAGIYPNSECILYGHHTTHVRVVHVLKRDSEKPLDQGSRAFNLKVVKSGAPA